MGIVVRGPVIVVIVDISVTTTQWVKLRVVVFYFIVDIVVTTTHYTKGLVSFGCVVMVETTTQWVWIE